MLPQGCYPDTTLTIILACKQTPVWSLGSLPVSIQEFFRALRVFLPISQTGACLQITVISPNSLDLQDCAWYSGTNTHFMFQKKYF